MNRVNRLKALKNIVNIVNIAFNAYMAYEEYMAITSRRRRVKLVNLSKDSIGFFETCMEQIENQDDEHFYKATRMSPSNYKMLLTLLRPKLDKCSRRKPIAPEIRISITILYLAHGRSVQELAWAFQIGVSTARLIVYETCQVIWDELQEIYVGNPTVTDWPIISSSFYIETGLPHCLGAIDGKQVGITGAKQSIGLLAACDANYAFTYVEVGALGSQSDGNVLRKSPFVKKIINNELDLPMPTLLPNSDIVFPYYFVADIAFPLLKNIMRPYPGKNLSEDKRNFNRKLSKARSSIDISFAVLSNRWRVLETTINSFPKNVDKIVLATIALHNFLIFHKDTQYFNPEAPEENIVRLENIQSLPSNNSSSEAFNLRNSLKDYLFSNE